MPTTADRIKELRERRGLSQQELAERCGFKTSSAISKIENSGDEITSKKLAKVADGLNTTPASLLGYVEHTNDHAPIYRIIGRLEKMNEAQVEKLDQLLYLIEEMKEDAHRTAK